MTPRRVHLRAPAKLNLVLEVLGRRPDGYHELDSVLMALELGDELVAEACAGDGLTLSVRGPQAAGVPEDASNLVLRAAAMVRDLVHARGRTSHGVHFELEKRVPAAAGLGGGSSDAAAAALACAELWGLSADEPELLARLADLGSDCPFFLAARASGLARCTGRGERVEPLPALVLPWTLAVVTPAFGCATAAVYAAFSPPDEPPRRVPLDPTALRGHTLAGARAQLSNALEPAAERVFPALAEFRACLEAEAPGAFRLAGSGSSCFGFFADARAAEAVVARVETAAQGRRFALRSRWIGPARSLAQVPRDSRSH